MSNRPVSPKPMPWIWLAFWIVLGGMFDADQCFGDETANLSLIVNSLESSDSASQEALLRGMVKGLEGRRDLPAPENWSQVSKELLRSDSAKVRGLTEQLSQIFGDKEAVQRALDLIGNAEANEVDRRRALQSLVTQKDSRLLAQLPKLMDQSELRRDAIRAFGAFDSPKVSQTLLSRFGSVADDDKRAIVEVLASRKSYANALVDALANQTVHREEIPAHVARSMKSLLGDSFTKVYGEVRELAVDREKVMAKYKNRLTPQALSTADPSAGRAVFQKTCAACHQMYGTGGKVGPDLTGSNRANLDYLLLNSVDPSYDVPEGYRMVIIQTVDGRVLNGVIAEENQQRVVLKTVDQPEMVILKTDIEARKTSEKSIMPDGQLDQMRIKDVINLVKYMQTKQQVELPQ